LHCWQIAVVSIAACCAGRPTVQDAAFSGGGANGGERNLQQATTLDEFWGFKESAKRANRIFAARVALFTTRSVCCLARRLCRHRMIFLRSSSKPTLHALRDRRVHGRADVFTRACSRSRDSDPMLSQMRLFISGSAPLLPETFNAFRARTTHDVERYGMSETLIARSNRTSARRAMPREQSHGFTGVSVRVMRDSGGAASRASRPVQVQGPNVFSGYWACGKDDREFTADAGFAPVTRLAWAVPAADTFLSWPAAARTHHFRGTTCTPKEMKATSMKAGGRRVGRDRLAHPDLAKRDCGGRAGRGRHR